MRLLVVIPFFFSMAVAGVIKPTTIDAEEFKKDMKILDAQLGAETDAERAEIQKLLAAVEPISEQAAKAEKEEAAVNEKAKEDLFEGDIVLSKEQLSYLMSNETERAKRQASLNVSIWGTAPIPFSFSPEMNNEMRTIVRAATAFWNENTCVNFKENAPGENKIIVVSKGGCFSAIGRAGNTQELSLTNNQCNSLSTATHELEHALGVYHEQSRTDRDTYVKVNKDNIELRNQHNFDKADKTSSMGLPYEFGSNMHYTQDSFYKDWRKPTLIALGAYAEYQNSMRGHMPSFLDVLKVNKYYKCDQKCANKPNPCKNGGYLDVRNCAKCVCPEGLGGADCTGNPEGCLVELTATASYTKRTIEIGKDGAPPQVNYSNCAYIVKAPAGKRIEVIVDGVWTAGLKPGCAKGGIELKTKTNMIPRGFRFCTLEEGQKKSFLSESNRVPILAWNMEGKLTANIQYRYV